MPSKSLHKSKTVSLVRQLRFRFLMLCLLSVTCTSAVFIGMGYRRELKVKQHHLHTQIRMAARAIDERIGNLFDNLEYLSRIRNLVELPSGTQRKLLETLTDEFNAYNVLAILDADGRVVCKVPPEDRSIPLNLASDPVFFTPFGTHERYIHAVHKNHEDQAPVFDIGIPLYDEEETINGLLFAQVDMEFLHSMLGELACEENGCAFIFNARNEVVLACRDVLKQGRKIDPACLAAQGFHYNPELHTHVAYTGLTDEKVYGDPARIKTMDWVIVLELPVAQVRAPLFRMLLVMLGLMSVMLLAAAGFSHVLSAKIMIPLHKLMWAAGKIRGGQLDARVSYDSEDELGILAATFNAMAGSIVDREHTLIKSQQDLATTLHSIGDAIITTDQDGLIQRMNPVAASLTGWSVEDAVGKPLSDVFRVVDDETRKEVKNIVERVLKEGRIVGLTPRSVLLSKDEVDFQIADSCATICGADGEVTGVVIVFRDVSELRTKEEALQQSKEDLAHAQHIAGIGSWDWRPGSDEIKWSNEMFQIYGVRQQKANRKLVSSLIHAEDKPRFLDAINHSLETGEPFDVTFRIVRPDGMVRFVHDRGEVIYDDKGNPVRMFGTMQDITDRRRMNEMQQAGERFQAIAALAGTVAQSFSEIIGLIGGYAASIRDSVIPGTRAYDNSNKILSATKRAGQLTWQLMRLARAGGTHVESELEVVSVNESVREAVDLVRLSAQEKKIEISIKPVKCDQYIKANPEQMLDVLVSLLLNAAEAMPHGGNINIEVASRKVRMTPVQAKKRIKPGSFVVIRIQDTGSGMSKEVKGHIFDPFFSTKQRTAAFGLGLSVAQNIIASWGGWISVRSREGVGTTFRILLPLEKVEEEAKSVEQLPDLRGRVLLLVDDDPEQLAMMRRALEQAGYIILQAEGSREALNIFKENADKIDLSLIDLMLRDGSGKIVLDKILRKEPQANIIMMSGFSRDYVRSIVSFGVWGFLQKPFDAEILISMVEETFNPKDKAS